MDNTAFVDFDKENLKNLKKAQTLHKTAHNEIQYSFEEAVTLTGLGKFHYLLMVVCGLCFMTVMIETMSIGIMLPFLKCDLHSTISEQGLIVSSGFIGVVVSSHMMGFFADTWGRNNTLRTALIFGFLTSVVSVFSVNNWMLIALRFLNGVALSGCQACVFSFLGEFHGKSSRVRHVTMLSMFLPIGLMCVQLLSIVILPLEMDISLLGLQFTPWRLMLLINSSSNLVALCGFLLLPESPKYELIQGNYDKALKTFRKMFKLNTGRPETEYPVKQFKVELVGANLNNVKGVLGAFKLIWSQTVPLFAKKRVLQTLNICLIMFTVFALCQGTFMWFPTMLNQVIENSNGVLLFCEILDMYSPESQNSTNFDQQCAGHINIQLFQILIAMGVVFFIIYLLFTFIVDYVGKKNLLIIWIVVSAISCLAIRWVSSSILIVIFLTFMLTIGTCSGTVSAIAVEYYPTNINAMAMCLIMTFGRLGSVVGSNIVGRVIFGNCGLLFYIYFGIIILIAFSSMLLPGKSGVKKESTENIVG